MAGMRPVPDYARVSKQEYRALRNDLATTCDAVGYDFYAVWNLVIDFIEARHARVLAGTAANEMTLAKAVKSMQKQVIEDRARREQEKAEAAKQEMDPEAVEEAVRTLARRDAERLKADGVAPGGVRA